MKMRVVDVFHGRVSLTSLDGSEHGGLVGPFPFRHGEVIDVVKLGQEGCTVRAGPRVWRWESGAWKETAS